MSDRIGHVLVIGGGIAALYAAIGAVQEGARATVVSKGRVGESGCSVRATGYNAAVRFGDSPDLHFADTVRAGHYHNDRRLVSSLTQDAPVRLAELIDWGLPVDPHTDGQLTSYGGSSFPRSVRLGDGLGRLIVGTLFNKAEQLGVGFVEGQRVVGLCDGDIGGCVGAIVYDPVGKFLYPVSADAVVMATGGGTGMFDFTTSTPDKSCDGLAIGLRAGVVARDLEMIQWHPTGVFAPAAACHGLLLDEDLRMAGGLIRNRDRERFMMRYSDEAERATRDVVSAAIAAEASAGRAGPNDEVWLDLSMLSDSYLEREHTNTLRSIRAAQIDLGAIPVRPIAHFLNGGVAIDEFGGCSVRRLFWAGEDAGGCHGVNRVGGNGLADAAVSGRRCGGYAARTIGHLSDEKRVSRARLSYVTGSGREIDSVRNEVVDVMTTSFGPTRSSIRMIEGVSRLRRLRSAVLADEVLELGDGRSSCPVTPEAFDAGSLLEVSLAIAMSAESRRNSLGPHVVVGSSPEKAFYSTRYRLVESEPLVVLQGLDRLALG